jgi:hypothetical protein
MPRGMVLMHWNERIGAEIITNFPKDIAVEERTLMQIYAQHEYSAAAGFVSLTVGALNLVSYYTGVESQLYLILLLNAEEDGMDYEEGLVDTSREVVKSVENLDTLRMLIPRLFQRLAVYPKLELEQKLGIIMLDEIKRMIINRFRNEVAIQKSEIEIWLKDEYRGQVFFDIDGILDSLIKMGILKYVSVKGGASDMIFFVQDIIMLRRPPVPIVRDPVGRHLPQSVKNLYIKEVHKFFQEYKISEDDSLKMIHEIILDPEIYQVLKLMRQAAVTRSDLEKLRKKGVENVDRVLKIMWEMRMIVVLQDGKKTEYYGLTSDFLLDRVYPSYNIDTILAAYKNKTQDSKVLLKALDLMKEEFYSQTPKVATQN